MWLCCIAHRRNLAIDRINVASPRLDIFRESSICKICQFSASENHRHLWIDEDGFFFHSRDFLLFMFVFKWREFFFKRHPILLCTPHISILRMGKEFRNQTEKWVAKATQKGIQFEKSIITLRRNEACSTSSQYLLTSRAWKVKTQILDN